MKEELQNTNFENNSTDMAQKLYKTETNKIEQQESNHHFIALGLAIASYIPIINYFNFLFIYNIISISFAIKALKNSKNNSSKKIISIISIIINILLFILTFLVIGLLINEVTNING